MVSLCRQQLMQMSHVVANARAKALTGTMPEPTSFETKIMEQGLDASASTRDWLSDATSRPACIRLLIHKVKQSTTATVSGESMRERASAIDKGISQVCQ